MADERPSVGFIGLGAMGSPMARSLLLAGYPVVAYDLRLDRVAVLVDAGARAAPRADEVVAQSAVVLTSLPSSEAFVRLAEATLVPNARPGQIFIDLGTTSPPDTRRLAASFGERNAVLLDVPVSGGPAGATAGSLYLFAGWDEATIDRMRPILEAIGGRSHITHCGPSGAGQVVKGVNQLMMALGNAAYLEAVAFGVRAGVDAATLASAIGDAGRWRADFHPIATVVANGNGESIGVKFRELPYFLRESWEQGFALPLTETLFAFCDAGERVAEDDNRAAPSFWHELLHRG